MIPGCMGTNAISIMRATNRNTVADLIEGLDKVTTEVMPTTGQLITAMMTIACALIETMPPNCRSGHFDQLHKAIIETAPTLAAISRDIEQTVQ